jgi:hypothetical protein
MFLEILPLLIVISLIFFIVYYRQSVQLVEHDPVIQENDAPDSVNKKKMGKKKLKHIERKEQNRRYQEYLESVKQDQLLREELKQEARERKMAKIIKSRKLQDNLEIQELNRKIKARLAQEQLKKEQEQQEKKRLSDLYVQVKDYIIKKRLIVSQDIRNMFSISEKMLDDIQAEMPELLKFDDLYIYLDDPDSIYNFILEKGAVDQSDILNFLKKDV